MDHHFQSVVEARKEALISLRTALDSVKSIIDLINSLNRQIEAIGAFRLARLDAAPPDAAVSPDDNATTVNDFDANLALPDVPSLRGNPLEFKGQAHATRVESSGNVASGETNSTQDKARPSEQSTITQEIARIKEEIDFDLPVNVVDVADSLASSCVETPAVAVASESRYPKRGQSSDSRASTSRKSPISSDVSTSAVTSDKDAFRKPLTAQPMVRLETLGNLVERSSDLRRRRKTYPRTVKAISDCFKEFTEFQKVKRRYRDRGDREGKRFCGDVERKCHIRMTRLGLACYQRESRSKARAEVCKSDVSEVKTEES